MLVVTSLPGQGGRFQSVFPLTALASQYSSGVMMSSPVIGSHCLSGGPENFIPAVLLKT